MSEMAAIIVAEAEDPVQAAIWVDALRDAGIEANSFERGVGAALGGAVTPGFARYPVVVGESDIAGARNVIAELAGGGVLAPLPDPAAKNAARQRVLALVGAVVAAVIIMGVLARLLG